MVSSPEYVCRFKYCRGQNKAGDIESNMFGMMRKKDKYLNNLTNPDIIEKINHLKDNSNDGINEEDLSYNVEEFIIFYHKFVILFLRNLLISSNGLIVVR